jgi:hypothetical protein
MRDTAEASPRVVAGRPLRCTVCEHDRFHHRPALLTSRGKAILDLEWLSPKAEIYICDRCGHVLWFRPPRRD